MNDNIFKTESIFQSFPSLPAQQSSSLEEETSKNGLKSETKKPLSNETNINANAPKNLDSLDHTKEHQEITKKTSNTSGLNLGSLLRLFKSSYFDAWMSVSYLWRYPSPGVHDYLVNQLYSLPDNQTEFYLTQLWYHSSSFFLSVEKKSCSTHIHNICIPDDTQK
jgi:phosphatidylinositol 4-kinase